MTSELEQHEHNQPVSNHPYLSTNQYSAANPMFSGSMGGFPSSSTSAYGSYSGYGGASGYSGFGGYGGYNPYSSPYGTGMGYGGMGGENMWQGFLGKTAESLGRVNNFLSMTGMLLDHISNHGKLLYSKGNEAHSWYQSVRSWSERHSEWIERLGFQIESSWRDNEDEAVRRRRMLVRRARTVLIAAFLVVAFVIFRTRRRASKRDRWEAIYSYNEARPAPYRN